MDSNVRDEFYEPVEAVNKTAIGAHVQTYYPTTSNIDNAGKIAGSITFELNTGVGEYLDLFKTHLRLQYTMTGVGVASMGDCPLSNIIARGQLYINGKKVASSQNWTQDAILSKRITFSRAYNASVNGLTYNNTTAPVLSTQAAVVAGNNVPAHTHTFTGPVFNSFITATAAGSYTDTEFLDALFIRDESCIIPPNSNVRLLLDIDAGYLLKMALLEVADPPVGALTVKSIQMVAYTVIKGGSIPEEYVMNLVTLNSFLSSVGDSTSANKQYQVSSTIVKAAVTFLGTDYATANNAKVHAGNILSYTDDTTTNQLVALDFKLNNINVPNTRWDFQTYGFKGAYINYINESGGISDSAGKESFAEWQRYGMIHLANIVKAESDKSNSLQVNCQFTGMADAVAFLIVTSFEENAIKFKYDPASGALLDTQTLL